MAKPAAEGLDPVFIEFLAWTRDNQRHKGEQTLAQLREEIGALRFVADVEPDPPWTTAQLDAIQAAYDQTLLQFPEETPLETFV
jgi:hypothetical protein